MAPIVSLHDVGKRYVKYDDVPTLISGVFRRRRRSRRSALWAVRHIDLDVRRGEGVGVIGRNGAGKSTMLAMLAGVTAPTEGAVAVRGRVAPLLRLGVGFHDELTGRENVYINGTILGLKEPEIDACFDEVVAFAELEEFIDTPVKFYSSGMQARLGFSVAVASRPDVLIVDEVLAVGDIAFQIRSFDRMLELQRQGTTILVVSHNLESIRRVCSRVLVLEQGSAHFEGDATEAISRFHELMRVRWDEGGDHGVASGSEAPLEIVDVEMLDDAGRAAMNVTPASSLTVRVHVRFLSDVDDPIAGLWVTNQSNVLVYASSSMGQPTGRFLAGATARFDITIRTSLVTGTYTVGFWAGWGGVEQLRTVRAPARQFYVTGSSTRGVADLGASFDVVATDTRGAASAPRDP